MESNSPDSERKVEIVTEEVTFPQLDLIIRHFDRHASTVIDVEVDYNPDSGELRIIGEPSRNVSTQFAKQSLEAAIKAARMIHPPDNLDMSA
ncbi:MAG: hypothetical protein V4678_00230 [Patescibacteria group bacterium]